MIELDHLLTLSILHSEVEGEREDVDREESKKQRNALDKEFKEYTNRY